MSDWLAATIILLDGNKITLASEDETSDALHLLADGQVIPVERPVTEYQGLGRCRTTDYIPSSAVARIVQHRAA